MNTNGLQSTNNEAIERFLARENERPDISSMLPAIASRNYDKEGLTKLWVDKIALALKPETKFPIELQEGLFFIAQRKAGRRIGHEYGLVEDAELFKAVAKLIPDFCLLLGMEFDERFLNISRGIVIHLQAHFGFLTLEEIVNFPESMHEIPFDKLPIVYSGRPLDVRSVAAIFEGYKLYVFNKLVGKAADYLRNNVITEGEKQLLRQQTEKVKPDPRYIRPKRTLDKYPDNIQQLLVDAYELSLGENLTYEKFSEITNINRGFISDYVRDCLLSLGEDTIAEATIEAWHIAKRQASRDYRVSTKSGKDAAGNQYSGTQNGSVGKNLPSNRQMRFEDCFPGQVLPEDQKYFERILSVNLAIRQFLNWQAINIETLPSPTLGE